MQRWILNSIAAALLAASALLARYGASNGLRTHRAGSATAGADWLTLLITAGAYLLQWGPVLFAALILFYANRRRN